MFVWDRGIVRQYHEKRYAACMRRLRDLSEAVEHYREGNRGHLPVASVWGDAILPKVSTEGGVHSLASGSNHCAYAFNSALSGAEYEALRNPEKIIMIFESEQGWNAHGGAELLPSIPRWPNGGDHYCFADGHVVWLHRKKRSDGSWAKEPDADWVIWKPVLKKDAKAKEP